VYKNRSVQQKRDSRIIPPLRNQKNTNTVYFVTPVKQQSAQSTGPVCFLIFCSISMFLLASLLAGRRPQCSAGTVQQGMYSIRPIYQNSKPSPASPGRSRVGPVLCLFSLLGLNSEMSSRKLVLVHSYMWI
jgi:hypothetical protein